MKLSPLIVDITESWIWGVDPKFFYNPFWNRQKGARKRMPSARALAARADRIGRW